MKDYLSSDNFPGGSGEEKQALSSALEQILDRDYEGNMFALLAQYQRVLADNGKRELWPEYYEKLKTLFSCGKAVPVNGPMVGIPVSIRDSDYFKSTAKFFNEERSTFAKIEWMATAWNLTFADTGLWMGKTFESVALDVVKRISEGSKAAMDDYDSAITRIGRNYFREPEDPNLIQEIGLPALTKLWHLRNRPTLESPEIFDTKLTPENYQKEKYIPYSKTGGIFLANMGESVVPEMNNKPVYQLNYRWPRLKPVFPMSLLVDEIVKIGEGIYLGQLVFATKHFNFHVPGSEDTEEKKGFKILEDGFTEIKDFFKGLIGGGTEEEEKAIDYGYQNNGFFLMMDPEYHKEIYADNAFPQLKPRPGESGYEKTE